MTLFFNFQQLLGIEHRPPTRPGGRTNPGKEPGPFVAVAPWGAGQEKGLSAGPNLVLPGSCWKPPSTVGSNAVISVDEGLS